MSYCTPCPPCDSEFPLLCEPLETTANGKRLVVEDSAACQKTIQTPVSQQVLKTDGIGNLTWTNGASGTVLRKDSTGLLEFATLNSVLQSGPVNLGSQPLTTTGTLSSGAITTTSVTATGAINGASVTVTGAVNGASVTVTGAVNGESAVFNRNSSSDTILVTQTGSGNAIYATGKIRSSNNIWADDSVASGNGIFTNYEGNDYIKLDPSDDSIKFVSNGVERAIITTSGNVGIGGATTPDSNAILQLNSTTQGLLPPRMTTTQKNAISTPPSGLVLYDTTTNKLCVYNGTSWIDLH